MQKFTHAYVQAQVTTTSQGQLLILLYDGGIKYLSQAKEKIAARDVKAKGVLISRALDVINELDGSLNLEKGGSLAENLHKLYFFCSTRLLLANIRQDPAIIDEVITILTGLRSAYAEILDRPEAKAAGEKIAAAQSAKSQMPARAPIAMNIQAPKPSAFSGRARAQAYGQQGGQQSGQSGAQQMPGAQHVLDTVRQAAEAAQASAAPVAEAPPAAVPAEPKASAASEFTPPPGFAPRNMAASAMYRKVAQG